MVSSMYLKAWGGGCFPNISEFTTQELMQSEIWVQSRNVLTCLRIIINTHIHQDIEAVIS